LNLASNHVALSANLLTEAKGVEAKVCGKAASQHTHMVSATKT
jgi:hypothetical protein